MSPGRWPRWVVEAERVGREAVQRALAEHRTAGRPVWYMDPEWPGGLIREEADGRRDLEDEDGRVLRELPPR